MKDSSKKPKQPFALEYQNAKSEIVRAINNAPQKHGVPFFLLETLLSELLLSVRKNAEQEFESARSTYERQLIEQAERNNGAAEKTKEEGDDNGHSI